MAGHWPKKKNLAKIQPSWPQTFSMAHILFGTAWAGPHSNKLTTNANYEQTFLQTRNNVMFRPHFHIDRFLPTNQKKKIITTLSAASNIQKRPGTVRGSCLRTLEISCPNSRLVRINVRNLNCLRACLCLHPLILKTLGLLILSTVESSTGNQIWFKNRVVWELEVQLQCLNEDRKTTNGSGYQAGGLKNWEFENQGFHWMSFNPFSGKKLVPQWNTV